MTKKSLYIFGAITLLVFPLPTFIVFYFLEDFDLINVFQFERLTLYNTAIGSAVGIAYAFLSLFLMRAKVFDKLPTRIETIVKNMRLNFWDCLLISICAGVGEELLFRSGVQFYLGPIITSILFVAIHGYLNPMNWRMSLYGLIVLPFIFIISYGFYEFGIWFSIMAHITYDLVLFLSMSDKTTEI